jgi:phosphocarrier protein
MIQKRIKVTNKYGIHARPASAIVNMASSFDAEVFIEKDGEKVPANSIMSLLMIAAEYGAPITIHAHGSEEEEVLTAIVKLFEDKFGED